MKKPESKKLQAFSKVAVSEEQQKQLKGGNSDSTPPTGYIGTEDIIGL